MGVKFINKSLSQELELMKYLNVNYIIINFGGKQLDNFILWKFRTVLCFDCDYLDCIIIESNRCCWLKDFRDPGHYSGVLEVMVTTELQFL